MHASRIVLLVIAACGAAAIILEAQMARPPNVPMPGNGLSVVIPVDLRTSGDFYVELTMPRATTDNHVVDETLPCDLSFKVERDGVLEKLQQVKTVSSTSEEPWLHVVQYQAGDQFHLSRGHHSVEVVGGASCAAASTRGAAVTVEEFVQLPTEHYLWGQLAVFLSELAVFGSLLTLLVLDIRARSNNRSTP